MKLREFVSANGLMKKEQCLNGYVYVYILCACAFKCIRVHDTTTNALTSLRRRNRSASLLLSYHVNRFSHNAAENDFED